MNSSYTKSIINNLDRLVIVNGLLVEAHQKALNMAERSAHEKKEIVDTCREIFETLSDKEKRSMAEESWFIALQKVLQK